MKLKGKIMAEGEGLPSANVYVSDSQGKYQSGKAKTKTSSDGNYTLTVNPSDYVTTNYFGFGQKTTKVSEVCTPSGDCKLDIILGEATDLPEVVITPKPKPEEGRKINWKKVAIIGGASLIVITAAIIIISRQSKKN
jgi:hypothetical protein